MLLLTLMLALQITTTAASASQSQASNASLKQMESTARDLQTEVSKLEASLQQQDELLQAGALQSAELLQDELTKAKSSRQVSQQNVDRLQRESTAASGRLTATEELATATQELIDETQTLQQETAQVAKSLSELSSGQRVLYNSHAGEGSTCWLVELNNDSLFYAAQLDKKQEPLKFQNVSALVTWINSQKRAGVTFMLIVKPSAATEFSQLAPLLRDQGVTFGFDLLPDSVTVIDPVFGASSR